MSEPKNPFDALLDAFRQVVREEISAALSSAKRVEKDWMKASELAELYGLPQTWFEERGRDEERKPGTGIKRTKPGRYVLFDRRDVEAFLKKKSNGS